MSGTTKLRELIKLVGDYSAEKGHPQFADAAASSLEYQLFRDEEAMWLEKNGKESTHPVPFSIEDVLSLPLGADGYVIPKMPELEGNMWYNHNLDPMPSTPAAFIDPETMVEWYSRANGLEDTPIAVKDIDWSQCRQYRKYEPLDVSIPLFGAF